MITWEPTHDGYIECFVGSVYGVVGLAHERTGWMARLECPHGQLTAPVLFHTDREAKLWVEGQIGALCKNMSTELGFSSPVRATASARPWRHSLLERLRQVIETYQQWNAIFFNLQSDGQMPVCYATAQHTARKARHQLAYTPR